MTVSKTCTPVPVIETLASKKMSKELSRRLRCTACRRSPEKRGICPHETGVLKAAEELDEKGTTEMMDDVQPGSAKLSYVSILPRRAVPCKSGRIAIRNVIDALAKHRFERNKKGHVDKEGVGMIPNGTFPLDYEACDLIRNCTNCGQTLIGKGPGKNCSHIPRIVKLHTFIYGTTYITVMDLQCHFCNSRTLFDGRDDALFAASKTTVFSRELMDFWLYCVTIQGQTFREFFDASRQIAENQYAKYANWGGFPLNIKILASNKAFSLNRLLTCPTCENVGCGHQE